MRGRVEVRRFAGDPTQKTGDAGMLAQFRRVTAGAGEFDVPELRMDGAVTDRVHRHSVAPAPAFRDGMMPFDTLAERASAEPAGRAAAYFSVQFAPIHLPVVFAFMFMFIPLGAPVIFMSMCIS